MGQVVQLNNSRKDFIFYVRQLQKLCEKDLSLINSIIIDKLDSNVPLIQEIASHLILSGGKRLRPLLTVCCFQMCKDNNNESKYIGLAAAVEFIHAATLLHDDVIDKSKNRRGSLSANEVWGNNTSVLVGDFLFSRAFQLMAKYGNISILKILSDTSVVISEGEILELQNDKDPTINEDIYFKVINGKTASLFSAACQVGAMCCTKINQEKINALKSFGTNFGMSFQLIDDAIDYSSTFYHLGKNVGDDFKQGKVTLPIILAYLRSGTEEKKYWKRTMQNLDQHENDFEIALKIINKYNCIEDTVERANHYANIAKDSLGIFDNTKFKSMLINLTDSSLTRFH